MQSNGRSRNRAPLPVLHVLLSFSLDCWFPRILSASSPGLQLFTESIMTDEHHTQLKAPLRSFSSFRSSNITWALDCDEYCLRLAINGASPKSSGHRICPTKECLSTLYLCLSSWGYYKKSGMTTDYSPDIAEAFSLCHNIEFAKASNLHSMVRVDFNSVET